MDQHGNDECAAQRELEAMHTIDTSGAPRLVPLEEPVDRYFKDEGGTSKVLFFGFELHGEITRALRELADSSSHVPLRCELLYEDMTHVEAKDDDGKDMFMVLGGLEPDSDKPTLNLTTRTGGVRYHINKVSMRRDGKKYRMRVGIKSAEGLMWTAMQPIVSIPTYVASKRSGRNKLERVDDSRRRINRLRLRKEQLAANLSRKNKDLVGGLLFKKEGAGAAGGANHIPIVGMPIPTQLRLPPSASNSTGTHNQAQLQRQQQQQQQQPYVRNGGSVNVNNWTGGGGGVKRAINSIVSDRQKQTKRSKTPNTAEFHTNSPFSPPTAPSRGMLTDVLSTPQQSSSSTNKNKPSASSVHSTTITKATPTVTELASTVDQLLSRMALLEQENRDLWRANNDLTFKVTTISRAACSHKHNFHHHSSNSMLLSSDSEDDEDNNEHISSSSAHERPGSGEHAMMPMSLSRSWSNDSGRLVSMTGNGTGGNNSFEDSEVPIFDMLVDMPEGVDGGFGNGSSNGCVSGVAVVHAANNNNTLSKPPMHRPVRLVSLSSLPADEGDPIA